MIGKTISHFRIIDEAGRGGMGVVYKAQDTRLDRIVALKFLPPHALASEDERARFYREARATAKLHHPNIATVFEIDDVAVEGGEMRPLIAMEYVDGETLTDRIASGPLKLKEAISIATQAAEGLKAAHAKDIVHRDIKSGNIMITSDGVVKVLDFGLAKTAASTRLTQMGSTLGTAAYMSPEQARGEEVDHRSDLWSLGAVLYEMVAGKVPFLGDYEQAIVYGILNSDPEPLTAVRTGVPMALEWIVTKLLAKEPGARYQHTDEVIVDLQRIDLTSSRATTTSIVTPSAHQETRPSGFSVKTLAAAAALALLIGAGLTWMLTRRDAPRQTLHLPLTISESVGGQVVQTVWPAFALSPDGRHLVFVGRQDGRAHLYLQDLGTATGPRPIEGTESARWPVFSPDGASIAFVGPSAIKRVSIRGGVPQPLVQNVGDGPGISWSEGDDIIYVPDFGDGIYRVPASGGAPQELVAPDLSLGEVGFTAPQLLPGGRHILCTSYGSGYKMTIISLDSGERTVLLEGAVGSTYLPTGHIVFTQKKSLLGMEFDMDRLVAGNPVTLLEGVISNPDVVASMFAVSNSGSLVYLSGASLWDRDIIEIDLDGRRTVVTSDRRGIRGIAPSPVDGRKLAMQVLTGLEEGDIWILDRDERDFRRVTSSPSWEGLATWLPDESGIIFASERRGSADVYLQLLDTNDPPRVLVRNEYSKYPTSVSVDGTVAYQEVHPETNNDIWFVALNDSTNRRPFLRTPANEDDAVFSPDGRRIAYASDESGRYEVYVAPVDRPGRRTKVSIDGGGASEWSRSGRQLFYQAPAGIMVVDVSAAGSFTRARMAFEGRFAAWALRPDGRAIYTFSETTDPQLNLVLNWFDEVKLRVSEAGGR